jgi:pyruvate formate lyase activating enzyme
MTGRTFEIREFTLHDGPGARTTVFFKGCPLRCAWCHNPEGQDPGIGVMRRRSGGEELVCGVDWTVDALARELLVNADFLAMSGGGITFSGGEPLMQAPFLLELASALRAGWRERLGAGAPPLHLAVETSGYAPQGDYRRVAESVDLVYQDLKHPFRDAHIRWTGVGPELIFENLAWLKESGRRFVARIPLVPGVNDGPAELEGFARMLEGARGLERVELLPFNKAAGAKYPLAGREWRPGFDEAAEPRADVSPFVARGIDCVVM